MSNLTLRVLVAAVGIPLFLLAIISGIIPFTVLVCILCVLCTREFISIVAKGSVFNRSSLYLCSIATCAFVPIAHHVKLQQTDAIAIALLLSMVLVFVSSIASKKSISPSVITAQLASLIYIALPMSMFVVIHTTVATEAVPLVFHSVLGINTGAGEMMVIHLFILIWLTDSFAYFGGRLFGSTPLLKRISPKKTIEGSVTGTVVCIGGGIGLGTILLPGASILWLGVTSAVVGIVSQFGDLAESMIKRSADVKDSSTVIPGHGGFLDRFDSLLFSIPVYYLLSKLPI